MRYTAVLLALVATPALADPITADRPGIGVDPEVVPQFTVQSEIGTDSKEVRIGVLPHLELDWYDDTWGAKYALFHSDRLKASVKVAYSKTDGAIVEVPANLAITGWFDLGADAYWSRGTQTYAAEFNLHPTSRLTVTPTYYWQDGSHAAVFASWIPPRHDNVQFDLGWDQGKVIVGISTAINFADVLRSGR